MDALTLKLRLAILGCIFLGSLVAIAATAGKEWEKIEYANSGLYDDGKKNTVTIGLWESCGKGTYYGEYTICSPINVRGLKKSIKEKLDVTRAFMIIGILLYGAAFLLLALAQLLKKDILQKTTAPIFWSIFICGIIAMSCSTTLINEYRDVLVLHGVFPYATHSYGWSYGFGWAFVAIALVGSIISTIALFQSPKDEMKPSISL